MIRRSGGVDWGLVPLTSASTYPRLLESADRLPLLITGSAGVSGLNALAYFYRRYGDQVLGQRPHNNWPLMGPGIVAANLEDPQQLRELARKYRFKAILSCGGSCALKSCELDPTMAERVNVESVATLCGIAEELNARLVHLSIDLVYSGTRGGDHREDDPADPVTVYGRTMLKAEGMIRERLPQACVGRISLPMGVSFNGHAGAIDWIQARFAKDKPATLYYDEIRTPTYVDCLNEVCEELLSRDVSGIWHLGGPRRLSLNQIAQIVNRVGGYAPEHLRGCYRIEAGPIPPRAGDVTMNSQRISDLLGRPAFAPWPYFSELVPTDREWHFRRPEFEGRPTLIGRLLYRRPLPNETLSDLVAHP